MALIVFYVENLKKLVMGSIKATFLIAKYPECDMSKQKKGQAYNYAWGLLVSKKIITEEEAKEIKKLVNVRNNIGHEPEKMLFDVSHSKLSRDYAEAFGIYYDYEALEKIKSIRDKISNNLHKHFVIQSSFDGLLFEDPEKVYFDELKKLRAKINKQYAKRLEELKKPR